MGKWIKRCVGGQASIFTVKYMLISECLAVLRAGEPRSKGLQSRSLQRGSKDLIPKVLLTGRKKKSQHYLLFCERKGIKIQKPQKKGKEIRKWKITTKIHFQYIPLLFRLTVTVSAFFTVHHQQIPLPFRLKMRNQGLDNTLYIL